MSGKRGHTERMTKLTYAERQVRQERNMRSKRKDKIRKKYKLPDTVDKLRPEVEAILNRTR